MRINTTMAGAVIPGLIAGVILDARRSLDQSAQMRERFVI